MDDYDVVVVGAGPGGSAAASFLGRAGVRTLLVDKAHFPRDKSCGDAVCSKSVAVLEELGLAEALSLVPGQRAEAEVFLNQRGDALHLPLVTETPRQELAPAPAFVIARRIFDDLLFRHARSHASVDTQEGFALQDLLRDGERVTGVVGAVEGGAVRRIRARIVLGADGAMSTVAQKVRAYDLHHKHHDHWIAAFRIYFDGVSGLGQELEIHFLSELLPGYLWIFPEGAGRANVGAGMVESYARGERGGRKRNLKDLCYRLLAEDLRLRERFRRARELPHSFLGWQLPCGSERRRLAGAGWMLVGDAAALVDPFSGEGIGNALCSARLAARTAVDALGGTGDLSSYPRAVWAELGAELEASTRLQRLARHPRLAQWLLHRAATRPRLGQALRRLKAQGDGARLTHPFQLARLLAL